MTARLLLLAAVLPLAGLAQLELVWLDTDDLIGASYNVGTAAVCQTLTTPEIGLLNFGQDPVQVNTVETSSGVFAVYGAPLPPFQVVIGIPQAFYINFKPTGPGPFTATLTITGTGVSTSDVYTLSLALTGTGATAPTLTDSTGHSYCPGDQVYVGRTQVGTTVQTILTITNPTQSAVTATVAGQDFGPTTPVTVGAGATQTLPITFTPSIPNAETGTLTVSGLVYNLAGNGFAAPLLPPTLALSGNYNLSSNQAQVSISVPAAASSAESGTLALAFQPNPATLPNDPNIVFTATGTQSMNAQVNPGDTAQYTFQTGTTAGTITFTFTLNPAASGVTASTSTTILPAIVALDLSTAVPATDEIILSLAGFDNTHAASALSFTFYDTTGKAIAPGLIQSNVTAAFANYYTANPAAGGVFNLQATFPVTGDITKVASVDVQFTNPAGVTDTGLLPVQ
ncbi:MAG: hypothetical protein ABSF98_15335 [Bryobacteraceae bacterium]